MKKYVVYKKYKSVGFVELNVMPRKIGEHYEQKLAEQFVYDLNKNNTDKTVTFYYVEKDR